MKINVGITSAGSAPAVSVIKALRSQKEIEFKIITFDMDKLSSGFFLSDKSYITPKSYAPDFINYVLRICIKEKIDILIPIIDEELLVFANNKEKFENNNIKLILNDKETIKLAKDKFLSYKFCLQNKILTPKTFLISDTKIRNMRFPWLIKPLKGRGSIGTFKVDSKKEFNFLKTQLTDSYIVQEFINGKEYTVDIVATPSREILQVIPRQRIATKAGMSYKGQIVYNKKLVRLAEEIAKKFQINGPANIQFKIDNNKIYLIEVNPKFAAGLPLTIAAGINIPLILIKLALGYKIKKRELQYRNNFYMLRYWDEIFISEESLNRVRNLYRS